MRFKGLDLNLLVALDILLQERNVTKAAQRMHVGQSAMSAALARLRLHFADDLLIISGRRMMPSALAEALRNPLREAILQIETVMGIEHGFVPAHSERHFRVEMPDHLVPVLLPFLTRRLSHRAPQILLDVRPPSRDPTPSLHKGELDLVVTPSIYTEPDYVTENLLTNELVVMAWCDNQSIVGPPDLKTLLSLQQVIVESDRVRLASILNEDQLNLYCGSGRTALVAPNFSCIPACLVGTNRISLIYRELAKLAARDLPLSIWEVPLAMPSMLEVMMFHPMRRQDGGLTWLREQLIEAAANIGA